MRTKRENIGISIQFLGGAIIIFNIFKHLGIYVDMLGLTIFFIGILVFAWPSKKEQTQENHDFTQESVENYSQDSHINKYSEPSQLNISPKK